jgi:hypothetical protein
LIPHLVHLIDGVHIQPASGWVKVSGVTGFIDLLGQAIRPVPFSIAGRFIILFFTCSFSFNGSLIRFFTGLRIFLFITAGFITLQFFPITGIGLLLAVAGWFTVALFVSILLIDVTLAFLLILLAPGTVV